MMKKVSVLLAVLLLPAIAQAQHGRSAVVQLSPDQIRCIHLAESEGQKRHPEIAGYYFEINDEGKSWVVTMMDRIPNGLFRGNPGNRPALEVTISKGTMEIVDSHFVR